MVNLSEQLGEAVQAGDKKVVKDLCERLSKSGKFSPCGPIAPGNRLFLDKVYLRFTQMGSREAVVYQGAGQGWIINGPEDVLRALYTAPPPPPPLSREPEEEDDEESPKPDTEEEDNPLGETDTTVHN